MKLWRVVTFLSSLGGVVVRVGFGGGGGGGRGGGGGGGISRVTLLATAIIVVLKIENFLRFHCNTPLTQQYGHTYRY